MSSERVTTLMFKYVGIQTLGVPMALMFPRGLRLWHAHTRNSIEQTSSICVARLTILPGGRGTRAAHARQKMRLCPKRLFLSISAAHTGTVRSNTTRKEGRSVVAAQAWKPHYGRTVT